MQKRHRVGEKSCLGVGEIGDSERASSEISSESVERRQLAWCGDWR